MADPVVWKHIGLHGDAMGTFVCEENKIVWKSAVTGGADDVMTMTRSIPAKAMIRAHWTIIGQAGHLRLQTTGQNLKHEYRFDGFPLKDMELLKDTLQKRYRIALQSLTLSASGSQYGLTNVSKKNLVFRHCVLDEMNEEGQEFEPRAEDEMMSLDLAEVSQCVLPGNNRNEIEVQFPESDAVEAGTDQLVSIRMYIPPEPDADPADKEAATAAEVLQQEIMATANIRKTTGDVLVSFPQDKGTFLTPRGRYAIELYDVSLRMRGQKYDYKIKYDDINRLFLLPKPDEVNMAFVIALDKPIRQGQQRYPCLVLQVSKEQDEVTVNLDQETLQKEYEGELQPVMRGALSNLIAKTFKIIAQKKVFIPGKFANANQQACVKCAVRANEGFLYPLEKQFVFIHKPAILVRFNEVESVEFQRYAGGQGSTRNFDLCVNLKNSVTGGGGTGQVREYIFSGIDRSDYAGLYNFLSGKKIPIKNLEAGIMENPTTTVPVYNEDEIYGGPDDGMQEESDDEDFDEAAAAEEEAANRADSDDSEEDMDDDELGSEIDDDLDSDLEDIRKKEKKASTSSSKASKVEKKQKKAERDDDDDDDNDAPKKRKKSKKDPNAPKKAQSAYILFASKMRSKVKEENPEAGFGELTKLVSERFKNLSPEERKEWDQRADRDKQRYKTEMASYQPPGKDDSDEDEQPKKKAKKDPNAPKRNKSSYMFYTDEMRDQVRKENPDASFSGIGKVLGAGWKKLSSQEKAKFEKMADSDRQRYQKEMEGYTKPASSGSPKKSAQSNKKKNDPNAPKRAQNAFLFFSQEMRPKVKQEDPKMTTADVGRKLGQLYKELSGSAKEKFERKAEKERERYKRELEAYNKSKSKEEEENDDDDDDDDDDDEEDNRKKKPPAKASKHDDGDDDDDDDDSDDDDDDSDDDDDD